MRGCNSVQTALFISAVQGGRSERERQDPDKSVVRGETSVAGTP